MWPRTAVIGAGFGDEGKGRVVDYLCSRSDAPLVVRFSGGHQAAHRVQLEDGRSHVFAHFGSGTFRGAPTYWSYHCPVNPMAMLVEFGILLHKDVKPRLYIDRRCPITTPFEIAMNAYRNDRRGSYDSCGVGIYETYKREKDGYHLLMEDVEFPEVFEKKVRQLEGYHDFSVPEQEINNFLWVMKNFFGPYKGGDPDFKECVSIVDSPERTFVRYESIIFEGSQGLLLDQTYGFFPHVTPSNTGTQNILEMGWKDFQVVLVTRAYQTRHGDGPMARESSVVIPDNPHEQNFDGGSQGKFRKAVLDLDMLRYAVMKDKYLRHHDPVLVITCMDLVRSDRWLIEGGAVVEYEEGAFLKRLREALHAKFVLTSASPCGDMTGSAHLTSGWQ